MQTQTRMKPRKQTPKNPMYCIVILAAWQLENDLLDKEPDHSATNMLGMLW